MSKSQATSRVEPRAHPVGRAIAVYGIVPRDMVGRRFTVDGRRAFIVRSGRLGLVAGYVDPVEFAPPEVERRRADRKWLCAQARHHERVLERLNARGSILPLPFLTTYENVSALEAAVHANGARWIRALARIGPKREYGLHVFSGPHALPDGDPYVVRVSMQAARDRPTQRRGALNGAVDSPLDAHLSELWRACAAAAVATRRYGARGLRGFAFGAALLVDERGDEALRVALRALEPASHALGVSAYLEGPRLPFTFG
jgi:hypothetical protein